MLASCMKALEGKCELTAQQGGVLCVRRGLRVGCSQVAWGRQQGLGVAT